MPAAFVVGRSTRRACAEDVPALVALRRQMFHDMGAADAGEPDWQDAARQWFTQRLSSPSVCLIVIDV